MLELIQYIIPVSYTHLDVYKRQVGWFGVLCITMSVVVGFLYILYVCVLFVLVIVRSKQFMPVSYTHLDVYKRQGLH